MKLSNTQLPGAAVALLGLLSSFGHTRSLFPAAQQVISSDFQCNPVLAEIPGTVRSSGNHWGAKKNLHGYCTSSASLTSSGNFLLGLFKICMIGIFTSLWKALDILNGISSLESAGASKRQLGMFTRAWSSQIPVNPLWMCPCAERGGKVLLVQIPSGPVCGKKIWEVQSCCLAGLWSPLCDREGKMNYLYIWIICREVEWISVQKQTWISKNFIPEGAACRRVRLWKVSYKGTESLGKNDKTFGAPKPIEWSIAICTLENSWTLARCVGSQQLEMLRPSGLPETMDIDRAVGNLSTWKQQLCWQKGILEEKSTGFPELQFKIFKPLKPYGQLSHVLPEKCSVPWYVCSTYKSDGYSQGSRDHFEDLKIHFQQLVCWIIVLI